MAEKLAFYIERARDLIERDKDLRDMQEAMERMVHLDFELPRGLRELQWMRNIRVTAPYDAFRAARRILSGLDERLTVFPLNDTEKERDRVNQWERALLWNFHLATMRSASFRGDIIGSAVLYDEIVAQVVHLPTQIRALSALGIPTHRHKAALRHGPFAIILHNPKHVHTVWSAYMLEAVLSTTVQTAAEIVNFWGEKAARDIARRIKENPDHAKEKYVVADFVDLQSRAVWAVHGDNAQVLGGTDTPIPILGPTENEYPFIPWAAVVGGNALDEDPVFRRQPLLLAVWKAEQWVTANILASLTTSEAIAEMARPKVKIRGPAADRIRAEYGTPGGAWRINDIQTDVADMQARTLDPALREAWDRFVSDMNQATLPRVLVTAEAQPGEPFGGFNLRLQTALGQLLPYKYLAERWYEEMFTRMLLWAHYTGEDIVGYETPKRTPEGRLIPPRSSRPYVIDSEDIDPERIYLKVELSPDVPTDRVAKITAAINLLERAKVDVRTVHEELGYTDSDRILERWAKDRIREAVLQARITEIQDALSGRLQDRALQLAQQMLAQQQAQAQAGQGPLAPPNRGTPPSPEQIEGIGIPGVGGELFNPAAGGTPPSQASPVLNTREGQLNLTRRGEEIL